MFWALWGSVGLRHSASQLQFCLHFERFPCKSTQFKLDRIAFSPARQHTFRKHWCFRLHASAVCAKNEDFPARQCILLLLWWWFWFGLWLWLRLRGPCADSFWSKPFLSRFVLSLGPLCVDFWCSGPCLGRSLWWNACLPKSIKTRCVLRLFTKI